MLTHLAVRDFAIVSELELEFGPGMTVLTGETGAGKSILVDAVSLALGERGNAHMVRQGCPRADVTATFELSALPHLRGYLEEQELEGSDGECLLRRTLGKDGRTRAYINGHTVPISLLRELGDRLVDIHGQHAHQSLLHGATQRQILDDWANHGALLATCRATWKALKSLREKRSALTSEGPEGDLEFLHYQAGELEALALDAEEAAELELEFKRLNHAEELQFEYNHILEQLTGGEVCASNWMQQSISTLSRLESIDPGLAAGKTLLADAGVLLEEASSELQSHLNRIEVDGARLQEVGNRLERIHDLARKHQLSSDQLHTVLPALQRQISERENAGAHIAELETEIAAAGEKLLKSSVTLHQRRQKAAQKLAQKLGQDMAQLGMAGGRFEIHLKALEEPGPSGADEVEFLVSANPGQAPQALARVASGGELSRISLAIQVIVASDNGVPSLIFDEVDVGIGGKVAEIVGARLRALGEKRQVLCITHLPQVAAQAHGHLQVSKHQIKNETQTCLAVLQEKERVQEIARMLGGVEISTEAVAHAREMLGANAEQH